MLTKRLFLYAGVCLFLIVGGFVVSSYMGVGLDPSSANYVILAAERDSGAKSNQASMHMEKGTAEFNKGNYEAATRHFSEAIKADPNNANAYNNRGVAYSKMGKNDRAISDYSKAIQLNPNFAEPYNNRSMAYLRQKDQTRACVDFRHYRDMGGTPSPGFARELESKTGGKC